MNIMYLVAMCWLQPSKSGLISCHSDQAFLKAFNKVLKFLVGPELSVHLNESWRTDFWHGSVNVLYLNCKAAGVALLVELSSTLLGTSLSCSSSSKLEQTQLSVHASADDASVTCQESKFRHDGKDWGGSEVWLQQRKYQQNWKLLQQKLLQTHLSGPWDWTGPSDKSIWLSGLHWCEDIHLSKHHLNLHSSISDTFIKALHRQVDPQVYLSLGCCTVSCPPSLRPPPPCWPSADSLSSLLAPSTSSMVRADKQAVLLWQPTADHLLSDTEEYKQETETLHLWEPLHQLTWLLWNLSFMPIFFISSCSKAEEAESNPVALRWHL